MQELWEEWKLDYSCILGWDLIDRTASDVLETSVICTPYIIALIAAEVEWWKVNKNLNAR